MKRALITGSNRGLGLSLVNKYLQDGWQVIATYRDPNNISDLQALAREQLELVQMDACHDEDIQRLAGYLSGRELDLIINNAGVYGPRPQPLGSIDRQQWREVLEANTLAPLMLIQAVVNNLSARHGTFAVISSRMGSIAENTGGGEYMYKSSKAAVNQVVKSLSIDLADQGITVVALHPSWVRTDMGGAYADLSIDESTAGMKRVLDQLTQADNGGFFNYDGRAIAW